MRCLVVYAHPVPTSYCAALRDCAIGALRKAGHEVKLLDLYAEHFDPVLSEQERVDYHTATLNEALVRPHVELLAWAQMLVFVYPTWWYGLPAILKGWLDRVWVPHVAFSLPEGDGPIVGLMENIIRIVGITTSGSPWWWMTMVGNPGRRTITRGMRAICNKRCRTTWLQMYSIDRSNPESRAGFLQRISERLSRSH